MRNYYHTMSINYIGLQNVNQMRIDILELV